MLAVALGLSATTASAQSTTANTMPLVRQSATPTVYSGPRFPGGPDSLQAAVWRVVRTASPALVGTVFLRLELDDQGRPGKASFLPPPPKSPAEALATNLEVQQLAAQLVKQLPVWQVPPGIPSEVRVEPLSITLPLLFGTGSMPTALNYSDENPEFPAQVVRGRAAPSLVVFTQMQIRYPVEAMRGRQQGRVFGYFEVSPTGAIERLSIAGSASPALDAEIMRVLGTIPPALTPPRLQGRPVRVGYVVPFTFRLQ